MPYYRWRAIDQDHEEYEGQQWAPNLQQLEHDVHEQKLTLITAQRCKLAWIERLSSDELLQLFEHIKMLLESGLHIWQSLQIVARYGSPLRKELAQELYLCVKEGSSFADTLALFPAIFNPLIICLVKAGQESGDLAGSLGYLVTFLRMRTDIQKKIREALRTPLITLSFFIAIVLIIFLAIVPSFETLMTSTNQVISPSMGRLFAFSTFLQKLGLFGVLAVIIGVGFVGYALAQLRLIRTFGQWLLTHIPGISGIYWSYELAGFFQAAALLVRGGMPLVQSLQSALSLSGNNYVQSVLAVFVQQVADGSAVDQAYADTCSNRAHPDIAPLLAVGSQSGMLAQVFEHSARLLFEYVERQLNRTVALSQPVIMSILGIMIALLLYTVYMPIIELPQTLGALTT